MVNNKIYWLDNYTGKCKTGAYSRSRIHLDIDEFEQKFNEKIVGIRLEYDYDTRRPSYNVEFILAVKDESTEPKPEGEEDVR